MTVNDFAVIVCKGEGLIKQTNIAQVKEILKVMRKEVDKRSKGQWDLYKVIWRLPK